MLWRYGNELKEASPERAMEIWEEMLKKKLPVDITARNMYIAALKKGGDRKYQQAIEHVQNLKFCIVYKQTQNTYHTIIS